jgi:hypothetical protein
MSLDFTNLAGISPGLLSHAAALGTVAATFLVAVAGGLSLAALLRGRHAMAAVAAVSAVAVLGIYCADLVGLSLLSRAQGALSRSDQPYFEVPYSYEPDPDVVCTVVRMHIPPPSGGTSAPSAASGVLVRII